MKTARFSLINDNVCVRLKLFGEDAKKLLIVNGWEEENIQNSDFIIINTCSFLKKVEDETVNSIKEVLKNKKENQKVFVIGCLPSISKYRLSELKDVEFIEGRELSEIINHFKLKNTNFESSHSIKRDSNKTKFYNLINQVFFRDTYLTYLYSKSEAYHLQISKGCLGKCSYCAERLSRGSLCSKPISQVIYEFNKGLKLGYKIFSLNADDTGVYGWDNNENLSKLLKQMLENKSDFSLMITECNPMGILKQKDELLPLLSDKRIKFITVPLQSGSRNILNKMKRGYEPKEVIEFLNKVKKDNPKITVNTHIILGFPGETEGDFKETKQVVESFKFNKLKIFKYSERNGTEASLIEPKIKEEVKEERYQELHKSILSNCVKQWRWRDYLLNQSFFF